MSEFATEAPATPAAPEAPPAPEPASVGDALAAAETAAAPLEPVAAPEAPATPFDPTPMYEEIAYLREQLAAAPQQGQPAEQAPQVPGFDPATLVDEYGQIRPDALGQFLDARNTALLQSVEQMFQQVRGPLEQQQQAATQSHYAELVDTAFNDHAADLTAQSPAARDFVEERAGALLGDLNQRFGTNPDGTTKPHVLDMAIKQAADDVRQLLGAAGSSATQQQASHLATLAGAPVEPGAGAAGAAGGPQQFKTTTDIVDYYSRNGAGFPQG
jgi:hypothetical protein